MSHEGEYIHGEERLYQPEPDAAKYRLEAEEGFRTVDALMESVPDGIIIAGKPPDFRIERASRVMAELTGRSIDALVGFPADEHYERWGIFLPNGTTKPSKEQMPLYRAIHYGEDVKNVEFVLDSATGQRRSVIVNATPLRNKDGLIIGGIACFRDITDRKEAENALREADQRKDEFLALLAHELRNPLASISAAAQLLSTPTARREHERAAREALRTRTRQLARLINDLLDVSRVVRGRIDLKKESVSLASAVARATEIVRPLIEQRRHTVSVRVEESVYVNADLTRLEQILTNLITNAAQYTQDDGTISIVVRRDGAQALVSVKDNGPGIQPEMQVQVFEMFGQVDTSLHRSEGGLGVGLYLVRRLVELHGGTIVVRSQGPSTGSEFEIRLPLAPRTEVGQEGQAKPSIEMPQLDILVVEDNKDTAMLMAAQLELDGHRVQVAHTGTDGVNSALDMHPDVILLDLGLPGIDGYEVARKLRSQGLEETLIVAVSGYGQQKDIQLSKEAGINYHLLKPMDYSSLAAILEEWQRGSQVQVH